MSRRSNVRAYFVADSACCSRPSAAQSMRTREKASFSAFPDPPKEGQ